jgi:LPXTG-motif cell wall-anchored protein
LFVLKLKNLLFAYSLSTISSLTPISRKRLAMPERRSVVRTVTPKFLRSPFIKSLCAIAGMAFFTSAVHAAVGPVGFVDKQIASGLTSPTSMTTLPDGRLLVLQQNGVVRLIKNDAMQSTNFYAVPNVDVFSERGCLGITADPNFSSNGYVYLYCAIRQSATVSNNQVLRITANGDVAGNQQAILSLPTIPVGTEYHMGGGLRFGPDGKLYIAVGGHEDGRVEPASNSFSQQLGSPFGKLLRINPDGSTPGDNPYVGTAGAYGPNYAIGLRNPFTFDIHPNNGLIYINEVGAGSYEEINRGQAGANYGWPAVEGPSSNPSYTNAAYFYEHGPDSDGAFRCSITGGVFYTPATMQFPTEYANKYLFSDFCSGKIYVLDPANPSERTEFVTGIGNPVNLGIGADGSLYYLARNQATGEPNPSAGTVGKIEYTGSEVPRIAQQPQSQTIFIGDPVTFTVSAVGATRYQWQRNGANIPGATSASYQIARTTAADSGAAFRVVTENSFGTTISTPAILTVTNNHVPQATITSPTASTGYATGVTLTYSASASDAEDGELPASAFTWQANFHHDTHSHPLLAATSGVKSGTVTIPAFETTTANTWIEFDLFVEDSAGQRKTVTQTIYPRHQVSSLRPAGTPSNGMGPIETDRHNGGASSKDGGQMAMDGIPYPKGLGVHAPSDVRYNLGGTCSGNLIADVGIDDSVGNSGSVVFQVYLDGQKAYDSGLVRGSALREPINVDLTGKRELRLVVTDGGDGNSLDRANWGGARLMCDTLPEDTLAPASSGGSIASPGGGGGCSTGGSGRFDPTLIGLALSSFALIMWRRRKQSTKAGK